MAFHDESRLYKCGRSDCFNERKYFRMIESRREQDSYIDQGGDYEDVKRYLRICECCELETRKQEFPNRPARWREQNPYYCTEATVAKTIRARSKGNNSRLFAKEVQRAKETINERKMKGEHMSRQETKKAIIKSTAQEMAAVLASAINSGDFFGVLSSAGKRQGADHHNRNVTGSHYCSVSRDNNLPKYYPLFSAA